MFAVVGVIVGLAGGARAQSGGYPDALVQRPLLLPPGMLEGGVALTAPTASSSSGRPPVELLDVVIVDLHGRARIGPVEVLGGFGLVANEPNDSRSKLLSATLQTRVGVSRGIALSASALLYTPTTFELESSLSLKRRLGSRFAVRVDTGPALWVMPEPTLTFWVVSAFARSQGQVQIAPRLAAYAGLHATVPLATEPTVDEPTTTHVQPELRLGGSVGVLFGVARGVDVYAEGEVIDDRYAQKLVVVGILGRIDD